MKKPFFIALSVSLIGFTIPCHAAGWWNSTIKGVRILQQGKYGPSVCIIDIADKTTYGFPVLTGADEKMVDVALKAMEMQTSAWIFMMDDDLNPLYTPDGDYFPTKTRHIGSVVATR